MDKESLAELEELYESEYWEELHSRSLAHNSNPESIYFQALALQNLKQFAEALEKYTMIYRFSISLHDIDYNIGLCHYHLANYALSAQFLKKYMVANPRHPLIHLHLMRVLDQLENYSEVNTICERAMINKTRISTKIWALSLLKLRNYKKSHRIMVEHLHRCPNSSEVWHLLGDLLAQCKYFECAEFAYGKALLASSPDPELSAKCCMMRTKNESPTERERPTVILEPPVLPSASAKRLDKHLSCSDPCCRMF